MLSMVAPDPRTHCLCEVIHIWSSLLLLIITHHYYKQVQSWLPSFWLQGKKKIFSTFRDTTWKVFVLLSLAVVLLEQSTLCLDPCGPDMFISIGPISSHLPPWHRFDVICLIVHIGGPPPDGINRPGWQTQLPCAMWPQTRNQMRSGNLISVSHLSSFENNRIWSRVIERERH